MTWAYLVLLVGCGGGEPTRPAAPAEPAPAPEPAAAPVMPRVPATTESRFAASHVLVAWQGAVKALPNVRRTQVEAKARAEEVRARALAGEDFADLARRYSDDSTASRGGTLGGFDHGVMVRSFEDALRTLKVGAISEVVESPFGYHVIRRDALTEVHGAHLMVSWSGAERAPEGVTRTKEEARARAEAALAAVNAGREWGRVVAEFSDGPLKDDDGDLGWLARGQLARPLDQAMFDLDIAATSALIETPRGFHILRRLE